MEDKYDPKQTIEIIKNSDNYLQQTIEEARNILSQNAPKILDSLDYLLKIMKDWTISNNNTLLNYVEKELRVDKKQEDYKYYVYILNMSNKYIMAGIIGGISKYAKNLDPKDPDYNEKVDNIKKFIQRDLKDRTIFKIIYADFFKKAFNSESKEKKSLKDYNYILQKMSDFFKKAFNSESKEKKSLKDYNYILQKTSDDLMNTIENLLEYRIKNREQFYNSLLEIGKRIYE